MTHFIVGLLPIGILLAALIFGPLPILVRGLIRGVAGRRYIRRWAPSVGLGLVAGMVGATVATSVLDRDLTLGASLLCLLLLLAVIDWQWRWLPIEWTLSVIALGVVFALQSGDPLIVFVQMCVPAGALLIARQILLWTMKKEALGLGDIWLIAGLGAFLAPFESFLLIGFAAVSGLLEVALRKVFFGQSRQRQGVAYGTHLCIIFVVIRNLGSLG